MGVVRSAEEEEEFIGLGSALESFREVNSITEVIHNLDETIKDDRKYEQMIQSFKYVLDLYQEQPHLLDPHLDGLLSRLVAKIRGVGAGNKSPSDGKVLLNAASQLMAHIIKVRGHKVVVRHLPHEVEDLETVVELLQDLDHSTDSWETRYVLLLWLAIIILIPFNMTRFDSGHKAPLADRVLALCQRHLTFRDKSRDAAAFLASKFLTRPDTRETVLPAFLDWTIRTFTEQEGEGEITGALMALCAVVKHGKREDLLPFTDTILAKLLEKKFREHGNSSIRKLSLKLVQRLGLTFLKSKVAAWRYQRGSRSLAVNLADTVTEAVTENKQEEEDYDIPDAIEDVVEELLVGLRDKETVVRWSAAKGVGRVTGRLPQELADDVVGSIIDLFSPRETDASWHGGCLALAELGRRGLLLPQRLPKVVPLILKALVYDERRGSFSVGSHIRDSACYVCWAFARAYEPEVLRPYVNQIASGLLVVTVFDREVNCRRAASAAFQENVGRQGTFPHGIDILTTADYFAVGSRQKAYLSISVYIAQYSEYTNHLMDHLVDKKVGHWDMSVRELSSKALHNLTASDPDYVKTNLLPRLLEEAIKIDLHMCHGAVLATGQIISALSQIAKLEGKSIHDIVDADLLHKVEGLVDKLIEKHKLRGLGGEVMRQAVADFIKNCALASLRVAAAVVATWQTVLDDGMVMSEVGVQQAAVDALPEFLKRYYEGTDMESQRRRDAVVDRYLGRLTGSELSRRGGALALGACPVMVLENKTQLVVHGLIKAARIADGTEKWAEARRDALRAMTSVVMSSGCDSETLHYVYDSFLLAFEDYTVDRRGDIGAWVREAAVAGVEAVTLDLLLKDPARVPSSVVSQALPCLAQQAVEKIDRTRALAGKTFFTLLHAKGVDGTPLPGVPGREKLMEIFPLYDKNHTFTYPETYVKKSYTENHVNCNCKEINWSVESETFPKFVKLLSVPEFVERIILGFIVSVGGITERLVKNSSQSLFAELKSLPVEQLSKFCSALLNVFSKHQKQDRVTLPLFKFLDHLITSNCLEPILDNLDNKFSFDLFALCKTEIARCADPNKLMSSCDVFCSLLQVRDMATVKKCLVQLAIFLCHKFPRIRKTTADKMYEALLTYADREIVPEEQLDEVMELLSDTRWDGSVEELKPIRNKICGLMNVSVPMQLKKAAE